MPVKLSLALVVSAFSGVTATTAQAGNRVDAEQPVLTKYTSEQLRRYALALIQIQQIKQSLAVRLQTTNGSDQPALRSQAKLENRAILQRYSLDAVTFNAMTNAVDTRPTVRGKVRQTVMQQTLALWK